jgi:hypothetical protein
VRAGSPARSASVFRLGSGSWSENAEACCQSDVECMLREGALLTYMMIHAWNLHQEVWRLALFSH